MRSEKKIAKAVTIISAVALIIGATGCATQTPGGSKLDHDELRTEMNKYRNVIKVCEQFGAVMECSYQDRDQVREEHERMLEAMSYDNYR